MDYTYHNGFHNIFHFTGMGLHRVENLHDTSVGLWQYLSTHPEDILLIKLIGLSREISKMTFYFLSLSLFCSVWTVAGAVILLEKTNSGYYESHSSCKTHPTPPPTNLLHWLRSLCLTVSSRSSSVMPVFFLACLSCRNTPTLLHWSVIPQERL